MKQNYTDIMSFNPTTPLLEIHAGRTRACYMCVALHQAQARAHALALVAWCVCTHVCA